MGLLFNLGLNPVKLETIHGVTRIWTTLLWMRRGAICVCGKGERTEVRYSYQTGARLGSVGALNLLGWGQGEVRERVLYVWGFLMEDLGMAIGFRLLNQWPGQDAQSSVVVVVAFVVVAFGSFVVVVVVAFVVVAFGSFVASFVAFGVVSCVGHDHHQHCPLGRASCEHGHHHRRPNVVGGDDFSCGIWPQKWVRFFDLPWCCGKWAAGNRNEDHQKPYESFAAGKFPFIASFARAF